MAKRTTRPDELPPAPPLPRYGQGSDLVISAKLIIANNGNN